MDKTPRDEIICRHLSHCDMGGMNVLVVGGGGREHALCLGLDRSNSVESIHCSPGNAGTSDLAINVDVNILEFKKILKLIKRRTCR